MEGCCETGSEESLKALILQEKTGSRRLDVTWVFFFFF